MVWKEIFTFSRMVQVWNISENKFWSLIVEIFCNRYPTKSDEITQFRTTYQYIQDKHMQIESQIHLKLFETNKQFLKKFSDHLKTKDQFSQILGYSFNK